MSWTPDQHSILSDVDSYKNSHYLQYPPNTRYVSSYIESRGGKFDNMLFFGLQAYLKRYLKPICANQIRYFDELFKSHMGMFNREGWEYILDQHGGNLPLEIKAVKEGSILPVKNAVVQVVNTDPKVPWLTSFVETALLRAVWYPTTVATLSWTVKNIIKEYLEETAENLDGLPFKLHDFGARGVSSYESSQLGGLAHMINFQGSDTISAIPFARNYYDADMPAFSIPAAEHSTITSWSRDGERLAYENMIDQFSGKDKIYAVVSDSYDIYKACREIWGEQLIDRVVGSGGTCVVRPDSGQPEVVAVEVVEILGEKYGYTKNSKGYKVLHDSIRVIQGDGVNPDSIRDILESLKQKGWSADNIAFGMGGALLQKGVDRDTMRWAMKASSIYIEGIGARDVFKQPITDSGKTSKKGVLSLIKGNRGQYQTIRKSELLGREDLLETVWKDGVILRDQSFDDIRKLANETLV